MISSFFVIARHRQLSALAVASLVCCFLLATSERAFPVAQESLDRGSLRDTTATDVNNRSAFLVEVPLPLVGNRDELVQRQVQQIAVKMRSEPMRPVVVLRFKAKPAADESIEKESGKSRGSQFERCLALARFLTSASASKVRLVAYVTESVEGHAVLPVLACESIIAAPDSELGRAAVDEASVDETVRGAYKDIVRRHGTLSEAAVTAMLDPNVEIMKVDLNSGESRIVTNSDLKLLQAEGSVLRQETLWSGGGLASFSAARMRQLGWVDHLIPNDDGISSALGVSGRLQNVRVLPEKWVAARVQISQKLDASRVNEIIRSIGERRSKDKLNLLLVEVNDVEAEFDEALRLALYLSKLSSEGISTAAIFNESCGSSAVLPGLACEQVLVIQSATLGSTTRKGGAARRLGAGSQEALLELERASGRSASLMTAAFDPECVVSLYAQQDSGKQLPMAEWQLSQLPDRAQWIQRETICDGGLIDTATALKYGLIDIEVADQPSALHELGLSENPPVVEGSWVNRMANQVLARSWLPRLLVVVGFMALMIEMGTPGLGVGGFVAALCFLGFFWIEGLQGNVEWLEILLFLAGMVALAVELFVLPGFGLFGIGGIIMVLASIVLASQTFVFPSNSEQLNIIANNMFWVAVCAAICMAGVITLGKRFENTPVLRWVTIEAAGTDDLAELEEREAIVHWEHLLGQDGLTTTRLNPAGKAQFGKQIVNVLGTNLISEGVPVRVVEVRGNSVFVEPLE